MTPFVQTLTTILSFGVVLVDITIILGILILFIPTLRRPGSLGLRVIHFFGARAILFGLLITLIGVVASLFYSEVAGFPPCTLCWWQRVFLYPQLIIFAIALRMRDTRAAMYSLVLSLFGAIVGAYNVYLQFGGHELFPCAADPSSVSCSLRFFLEFGYVTIPTMALTTFLLLIVLMKAHMFSAKH